MTTERNWDQLFAENADWSHDGNPMRPYARLSSGLISNGYFNARRVAEDGELFGLACRALWRMADGHGLTGRDLRVVGAETGGIALSSRIAEAGKCKSAHASRVTGWGKDPSHLEFRDFDFLSNEVFLLVDVVVTTGGTLTRLRNAVNRTGLGLQPKFAPIILALCSRSDIVTYDNRQIVSLVKRHYQELKEGENPFTPDGKELVPPVRPKANWHELIRDY